MVAMGGGQEGRPTGDVRAHAPASLLPPALVRAVNVRQKGQRFGLTCIAMTPVSATALIAWEAARSRSALTRTGLSARNVGGSGDGID